MSTSFAISDNAIPAIPAAPLVAGPNNGGGPSSDTPMPDMEELTNFKANEIAQQIDATLPTCQNPLMPLDVTPHQETCQNELNSSALMWETV